MFGVHRFYIGKATGRSFYPPEIGKYKEGWMTVLLITGLSVIVLGLSLMVMWRTLTVTATVTAANRESALTQLGKMYIGIILAGFVILLQV